MNSLQAGVTAMRFNHGGNLLASGSKDTDLIVWDIIQESGLYKLKVMPSQAKNTQSQSKNAHRKHLNYTFSFFLF